MKGHLLSHVWLCVYAMLEEARSVGQNVVQWIKKFEIKEVVCKFGSGLSGKI